MVANEYMTRGEMLPSEVVLSLVTKRLEQRDCVQNGWILDGEKQACDIDASFHCCGLSVTRATRNNCVKGGGHVRVQYG